MNNPSVEDAKRKKLGVRSAGTSGHSQKEVGALKERQKFEGSLRTLLPKEARIRLKLPCK